MDYLIIFLNVWEFIPLFLSFLLCVSLSVAIRLSSIFLYHFFFVLSSFSFSLLSF